MGQVELSVAELVRLQRGQTGMNCITVQELLSSHCYLVQ